MYNTVRRLALVFALCYLPFVSASAQEEEPARPSDGTVRLLFSGSIHGRATYAWDNEHDTRRLGAGIRRARLKSEFIFSPRASIVIQFEGSDRSVVTEDVFLAYKIVDGIRFRIGRFLVPQPRSFVYTFQSRLDGVDRAAIGEIWARHTVGGSARDFGVDVDWAGQRGQLQFAISNGDGSWDRIRGNYRGVISTGDPTDGVSRTAVNVGMHGVYKPERVPGLEYGGFSAYNTARNPNSIVGESPGRDYISYGAHLYWGAEPGSQPVRLKADLMGIRYAAVEGMLDNQAQPHTFRQLETGYALTAAVGPTHFTDAFVRVERYQQNALEQPVLSELNARDIFFSAGFSISPSALRGGPFYRERFTLAYNNLYPDGRGRLSKHQIVFQAQLFI